MKPNYENILWPPLRHPARRLRDAKSAATLRLDHRPQARRKPNTTASFTPPWPGVNRMLRTAHIQNYSIYEREIERQTYLFSYLEYTGKDFASRHEENGRHPETRRCGRKPILPVAFARAAAKKNLGGLETGLLLK